MSRRLKKLDRLLGVQAAASDPEALVWLSASAGTGKTHVLMARVLRLLLGGAEPASILCLTFTKAGAAEMADRIHARLAHWVRLPDAELAGELRALDEPFGPDARAFARTLFARVLDATGGGLRIQTIHSFCQTLLAAFPAEAGLVPGFRPLEGREEAALARSVLAELLVAAEAGGDLPLIRDVQALSRRLGEQAAETYLRDCARAPDALAALGPGIEAKLRRALGVPDGDVEAALAEACADGAFDCESLHAVAAANARWGTRSGLERADRIAAWLAGDASARAAALADLHLVWAKADGLPRSCGKGQAPNEPGYPELAARLCAACSDLLALRAKAGFAGLLAAGLRAGQAYARAYAEAKRAAGLVDFDDLIRATVALLETPGMGDWVRYKLDQSTDHVLVDEAQDTNARQWAIVGALASEYFAGEGARGDRLRTIFTVGDFKQAIFGFQGTDPAAFGLARSVFSARAAAGDRAIAHLSLDRSFRSSPAVLAVVDRLLDEVGADALGLPEGAHAHQAARSIAGTVTLWRPHSAEQEADEQAAEGEESWADDATRGFATKLARQVKAWLDERLWIAGEGRPIRPEDVLILVRKRGTLASLIVARLHAEGVPVAGVDRLRLDQPLAVRDLLAAIRFVLQPEDDLNLAGLLVSPLFGWSQERLFQCGYGRPGPLWGAVRDCGREGEAAETLAALLAAADLVTPYRFLERILSGPLGGRRRLMERLGEEARDPIEELLGLALRFEAEDSPSLQMFLDWFDRGEVEIKRDPSAPADAVRVMTVHGAKGLEAPVVILADATGDPELRPTRSFGWGGDDPASGAIPIFRPRKEERFEPFAGAIAAAEQRDMEEHWRLLYVALTRARERLVVGGALGPRAKGVPPEKSWYQAVDRALAALGAEMADDPLWGGARHFTAGEAGAGVARRPRAAAAPAAVPAWLRAPAPREERPPRPLAPSAIGVDDVAAPPAGAAMAAAARRGRLLHALFERLPAIAPVARNAVAERWLRETARVEDAAERAALVRDACHIVGDPAFADLFGPGALAEAPIAAVVDGRVIAGTVDRLLVDEAVVKVVDFKTGRRVPAGPDAVPAHHLDQMAAYAAALAEVFPGRRVEAALLYTAAPRLIMLPPALLAARKPGFTGPEQKLPGGR